MVSDTSHSAGTLSTGHSGWPGIALSHLVALSGAVSGSVLATALMLISPLLQNYWASGPEESPFDRLTLFRTMLAISGRMVVARLAAVPALRPRSLANHPATRSADAQGCGPGESTQRCCGAAEFATLDHQTAHEGN
ncbi:hypothetical protein GCM10027034_17650 [Ramlibacter solisilvae]|nr:hypothetical protein [Ramlibacter tataouinensis]